MKLLFSGDIVVNSNRLSISNNLNNYFKDFDYRICNFEGPIIINNSEKIVKCGPHVYNDLNSIELLKSFNFNYAALANNHIYDYGYKSLENTIKKLNDNNIGTFGAGLSYAEAYKPLIIEINNERICIINACQAEFGVLKEKQINTKNAGYAWINSPYLKQLIKKNLKECTKIILFFHAGLEEQIIPLPEVKKLYHDFADLLNGKGAIIATHPHIVQGFEIYNDTPIFYSLGNFSFYKDKYLDNVEWNRGILVTYDTITNATEYKSISIKNKIIDFDYSESFKKDIEYRSELIKDNNRLNSLADEISEKCWNSFYKSYYEKIFQKKNIDDTSLQLLIVEIFKRIIKKVIHKNKCIKDNSSLDEIMLLHNIQIESHRWCVERYLYNIYQKNNNIED